MRIVFIGAVDFSAHCLEEVLRRNGDVVAVFTPRREATGSSDYADLALIAARRGVPSHMCRRISDPDTMAAIRSLRPDVVFVFGCSQLLPKELLELPPLGCIGTHPALLPRNRGRHPLIWALVEGLSESGLTFFFLDEGVDSGDILWQKPFAITSDDDASSLYRKIKELATEAIGEMLPLLESGCPPRRPQDHSLATYWRKRTETDGQIDWARPVTATFNLIRGLTHPYVGAHTFIEGHRVRVWRSRVPSRRRSSVAVPGDIVDRTQQGVLVQCGDGLLELLEWDCPVDIALRTGCRFAALAPV